MSNIINKNFLTLFPITLICSGLFKKIVYINDTYNGINISHSSKIKNNSKSQELKYNDKNYMKKIYDINSYESFLRIISS